MEIDPNPQMRGSNNNQSGQPVPPQGVPPIPAQPVQPQRRLSTSSQDVRNLQDNEEAKRDGAPISPAHQVNPSNSEEQNRAIEAFTRRMALLHGLASPDFQGIRIPPQLPAAPIEDPEDNDQEMKTEEKEEKEEEEEEDDEDEYLAAEGDKLCSICYHPMDKIVIALPRPEMMPMIMRIISGTSTYVCFATVRPIGTAGTDI